MLATLRSSALSGVDALEVHVEVDVGRGLPSFDVVGLPGTSVREARDRVRTAIKNAGFEFPLGRVTVNLAPAHLPKSGTWYDLPIAVGLLMASGQLDGVKALHEAALIGELSLDGSVRPVRGALCVAAWAAGRGLSLIAPQGNEGEIDSIPGLRRVTVSTLVDLAAKLRAGPQWIVSPGLRRTERSRSNDADPWREVQGQEKAKRALQIAVAGGHHVIMMGPPGAGKTMLARSMLGLCAPLTPDEVIDVSRVYSVAGMLTPERPLIFERPFRNPHHSVTAAGLFGGGAPARPGEVSLAHRGILFLDELAEFHRYVLEGLREPLEEGAVTISRATGALRFPARFTLVAALNPCPCGFLDDPERACTCRPGDIDRYRRRLSGPLLDRIDLFVKMARVDVDLALPSQAPAPEEGAARRREEIAAARAAQSARFGGSERRNGDMSAAEVDRYCRIDAATAALLRHAARSWSLSARAVHRALKVARTIADLEGEDLIRQEHVAEALAFRSEGII